MMFFLSNVSHSENYFDNKSFQDYKRLLQRVTNKIDKWYDKRQGDSELQNEKFSRDEDYVELDQSPSHFDSTDEENTIMEYADEDADQATPGEGKSAQDGS